MGWAYSVDLREKVVGAFDVGDMTDEQVAELSTRGASSFWTKPAATSP